MGRIRLRRPRGAAELVAAAVVALAVLVLVARTAATAVGTLKAAWPALLALALLTGAVAAWRIRQATTMRRREKERLATLRITLAEFDTMDDRRFEYALRDLLVRDGWPARRVGGGGDQAADVIGDHPQRGRIREGDGRAGPQSRSRCRRHQRSLHPRCHGVGRPARRPLDRPGNATALGRGRCRSARAPRIVCALPPEPTQACGMTGKDRDRCPSRLGVWCSTRTGRSTRC